MNAGAVKVDAMGFAESARALNWAIRDRVSEVVTGVRRAHTMLSMLKFRMDNNNGAWTPDDIEEIGDMVDMALMSIPHHYSDLNDPVDQDLRNLSIANEGRDREVATLSTLLEAMTFAAQPTVALRTLQEQAEKVYEIAQKCPAYEPDWRMFRETIEARGFVVKANVVGGMDLGPSVLTPDMLPKRKKVHRKVDELVGALQENEAAIDAAPVAARSQAKGARHA